MVTVMRRHSGVLATLGAVLIGLLVLGPGPAFGAETPDQDIAGDASTESTFDYPPLPEHPVPLIYGGDEIDNPGWVVALFQDGSFLCTGSLVDPEVVLTAAHCVDDLTVEPGDYSVLIGEEYLYGSGIRRTISQVHVNPHWTGAVGSTDLALLGLSSPANGVPTVRMNTNAAWPEFAQYLAVAGWGNYYQGSGASPYLQAGDVYATSGMDGTYDPSFCNIGPGYMGAGGQFCFGGPVLPTACPGDSGGPVVGRPTPSADSGDLVIYGVVSYGPGYCGNVQPDDVAQAVSGNTSWIRKTIDKITDGVDIVILGGESVVSKTVQDRLWTCTSGLVDRIAGTNRYDTAAAVSAKYLPANRGGNVYVAVGTNFPDALAGSAAAGAGAGGPVLLVRPTSIPSQTATELKRLNPDVIVLLGGTAAVSASVENSLRAYGTVVRVPGSDRYSTGSLVSSHAFPSGANTAYVATGTNFPDALAGGPAAVGAQGPVLLVQQGHIPSTVRSELARLGLTSIKVLGGTVAVSAAVEADLKAYATNVSRLSGSNRYATAAAVSKDTFAPGMDVIFVATGANFPDALAGGPIAGILGGPILLVRQDSIPSQTKTEIERLTGRVCASP